MLEVIPSIQLRLQFLKHDQCLVPLKLKTSQVQGCTLIIPTLSKAEARGFQVQAQPGEFSDTMSP